MEFNLGRVLLDPVHDYRGFMVLGNVDDKVNSSRSGLADELFEKDEKAFAI